MDNKTRIRNHYNSVSAEYNEGFETGILATERRKERKALFGLLKPTKGDIILDAGCGSGFDAKKLKAKGCRVTGIDCSEKMIQKLNSEGIECYVGDLESFHLDKEFEKIICSGATEFVEDFPGVLDNFHKHLSSKGIVVALIPKKNLIGYLYKLYHLAFNKIHITLRSRKQLEEYIQKAGFINSEFINASLWVYAIRFEKN